MGKPRKKPPNDGPVAVAEPADIQETKPTETKRPAHRPKASDRAPIPTARNFFDKLADISRDDWGTRANIHLYRLEPFTDRLRSGTVVFIMKYAEPIDETRILMDHGSGRYRALLTFRKPSSEKGDELDRHDFDLLNIKFPPKIPKGEWVDDPRNKKWEWARNFYENGDQPPAQPSQTDSVVETMRTLNEIRRDVREEMQPAAAPTQPSILDIIRGVKEILPQPAVPTENTLLNTVVTLLTAQITAQQTETAALRAELRSRQDGGGFSVEKLVAGADKVMPLIERLWPAAKAGAESVVQRAVRSNMSGWQEFLQPMMPEIIKMPVWGIIAQGMMMKAAQPQPQNGLVPANPTPALNPAPQQAAAPQTQPMNPTQSLVSLFDELWRPMRNQLFADGDGAEIGDYFASWVYDGYSSDPRYDQAISAARMAGVPTVIGYFKQSPYWTELSPIEPKFTAFLEAMLKWEPPAEEPDDDGVIDLSEGAKR